MKIPHEEMLSQIKARMNMLVIVAVLLSTALSSLYQFLGNETRPSSLVFLGTLIPAIYILTYIVYELFKKRLKPFLLNIIRYSLLVGVGMFMFPITFISFFKGGAALGPGMKALLYLSTWGIPLVAIAVGLIVVASVVLSFFAPRSS